MNEYVLRDFLPLISLFLCIIVITIAHQLYYGRNSSEALRIGMASFFLIFGAFKLVNLAGFAKAYGMYDIIAKQFPWYGYLYPFIEIVLGLAYLLRWNPFITNSTTLVLMLVSAAGVFTELQKGSHIVCACLGTVFNVPMTYVTLAEDLLMALMALCMLLRSCSGAMRFLTR